MLTRRPRAPQEDDDALSADKFIQKAGFLLSESKDEALELQYNTCYARILDSKVRPGQLAGRLSFELQLTTGCPFRAAAQIHRGGAAVLSPQPARKA